MDTTVQTWFTDYITNVAQIPADSLPLTSPLILTAQRWGEGMVPWQFNCVCPSPDIYQMAVCCAGVSFLLNWAPDVPTAANPKYFADLRTSYGVNSQQVGLITSAGDQGTADSFELPDWAKNVTMQDLQWLKDPFGRQLLGLLQQFGSLWGLS